MHELSQKRRICFNLKQTRSGVIDNDGEPKRSAAFERVLQRAAHYAEGRGQDWTGAELLLAIFAEAESPAARLLDEQGLTYQDAVNFIIHGTAEASPATST
jgi:ATP-dependent Clp protease ATP-binding subunit ClpA